MSAGPHRFLPISLQFFPDHRHNTDLTTTPHDTQHCLHLILLPSLSSHRYTPPIHILPHSLLSRLNHPGTPLQMTNIINSQTPTTTHYTHFAPHPPIIHVPQHSGTVNHTHPLLSKTKLKLTSHNTAKNLENIEAIILSHFHQDTDILCLQELPNTPQRDPSLNLTMYCNVASDHTNGVAIILPNYLSTFSKLVKHPNIHGTLIAVEITLPGFLPFYILNVYKSHITSTQQRLADTLSKLQLNNPYHILTSDFNTHLQPFLDTDNVRHPKKWPWLEHQIHPPN